jgi:hypothetical protein
MPKPATSRCARKLVMRSAYGACYSASQELRTRSKAKQRDDTKGCYQQGLEVFCAILEWGLRQEAYGGVAKRIMLRTSLDNVWATLRRI